MTAPENYGTDDATYQAAGGQAGIANLVNDFYDIMDSSFEAAAIRAMHPDDLAVSRDKLVCFLSGWMGGPALFAQKYGSIDIPQVHAPLPIGTGERDAWIACMDEALKRQGYEPDFVDYLKAQFRIPADRILQASSDNRA